MLRIDAPPIHANLTGVAAIHNIEATRAARGGVGAQVAALQRCAAQLLAPADAARHRFGAATAPHDRNFAARYEAQARADIGDDAFDAAWQEGSAWPLEEAIADLLGESAVGQRTLHADSR